MKTRINREKLLDLMNTRCQGNYNKFSRELGVDPAHLYRFINTGIGGGKKLILALMGYCDNHNISFRQFLETE